MTLVRTSILNGIAVIIKMLTLLGINKILAIYVGPTGYAAMGQFQNAVQMVTTFASGAINTGVTKYTAQYDDEDEAKQHKLWRTAGTIALVGSVVTGIFIAIFNRNLAVWFLNDAEYGGVFLWFAATLTLFTFNTLLLAILNGKKEILRYVSANIAGSIFSLVVTGYMAIQYGLYGTLVALAIYQSISFFVTLAICYKASWFNIRYMFGDLDKQTAINLAKYTAMALTAAACVPLSQILVRNHLGKTLGWQAAGYWEAIWRLSSAYLMVMTTTLSVYYLPKLSGLKTNQEVYFEIVKVAKAVLPLSMLFSLFVYIFRDFLIGFLFTKEFTPMRDLFLLQILGDFFKISSWILAYVLISKAYWRIYIFLEVFFSLSFYGLTYIFSEWGIQSATMAYSVNYFFYLISLFFVLKMKKIF